METSNSFSSLAVVNPPSITLRDTGPNGVLNVNKPVGWTSHDVVRHLRGILGIQKIGHAGTLDPPASGVLPILVGKGTKIAEYLMDWEKEYVAVLRLGQRTDTEDATGTILEEVPVTGLSEAKIRSIIGKFQGTIQQVPPMYSAIKVSGQPLYKLASKGKVIERQPRTVEIDRLEILSIRGVEIDLRVVCSKGTYVRTLCADIGEQLQVGGHLQWLERRRVGTLHISQALEVQDVTKITCQSYGNPAWLSLDGVLNKFRSICVSPQDAARVMHGNAIPWSAVRLTSNEKDRGVYPHEVLRVKDQEGRLLALGQVRPSDQGTTRMGWTVSMIKVLVEISQ
jgi:tRNA pseudouridine55 synthase